MSLRDKVRAHWQKQLNGSRIEVKVPEWDEVLYFNRGLTLGQRIALESAKRDEGMFGYTRELIMLCARTEKDEPAFQGAKDRSALNSEADPEVMTRIAGEVMEQLARPTMEEAEGNSSATQT